MKKRGMGLTKEDYLLIKIDFFLHFQMYERFNFYNGLLPNRRTN
jgi:hypothetical protein